MGDGMRSDDQDERKRKSYVKQAKRACSILDGMGVHAVHDNEGNLRISRLQVRRLIDRLRKARVT